MKSLLTILVLVLSSTLTFGQKTHEIINLDDLGPNQKRIYFREDSVVSRLEGDRWIEKRYITEFLIEGRGSSEKVEILTTGIPHIVGLDTNKLRLLFKGQTVRSPDQNFWFPYQKIWVIRDGALVDVSSSWEKQMFTWVMYIIFLFISFLSSILLNSVMMIITREWQKGSPYRRRLIDGSYPLFSVIMLIVCNIIEPIFFNVVTVGLILLTWFLFLRYINESGKREGDEESAERYEIFGD